jgi:hypothetical protein
MSSVGLAWLGVGIRAKDCFWNRNGARKMDKGKEVHFVIFVFCPHVQRVLFLRSGIPTYLRTYNTFLP